MRNHFLKKNGKVYIVSGKLKGRKISFTSAVNLRPTTNRIRKTVFEWLTKYIKHARCLDCFAGSGALGIEAISRHAEFLTFLEIRKQTIMNLKNNIHTLNIHNLEIIHTNTLNWLKKHGTPYDIIFIDPPYHTGLIQLTLELLEKNKWVKKNSLIYIEKAKGKSLSLSKNWILHKKKITNDIEYYLYFFNISNL
ncbi:16S rRNA (guanine(966)-N(2))-methyltransferase RsmD [Buchnera aphidicola (Diuraphis noxia)]|uniref:Ribosomal RNA small subunit methyltransferase D n=1 Tax=Buchnera aphidicola subsp. Diuraphis noxia TaxID=118101 RepID=A0A1B2H809_BUCDN|nr:16S rRNA (guanine(966)-N(2))-methyltransferase RsmD [Buchnera aphidicola]ANZ22278.1 16S rRNA (guanine(966)-N(2))-methyltransferase RsmD [Buchnera aphidicola (Diuraphis noxia)]